MKVLIIGAGTVGTALGRLIEAAGHTVEYLDYNLNLCPFRFTEYDFCHVTIPMVEIEHWVSCVYAGYKEYKINNLIIESSITPFALDDLSKLIPTNVIYSPIRATEAIMPHQLKTNKKFWAYCSIHIKNIDQHYQNHPEVIAYFNSIYPQGHQEFECAESLAFGKMLEVVDFGLQIMFAQQVKLACDEHGWNFEEAYTQYRADSKYGYDYNKLGPDGAPTLWVPRAIFKPGVIGGKCVIQDAELLWDANLLTPLMHQIARTNDEFKEKMNK